MVEYHTAWFPIPICVFLVAVITWHDMSDTVDINSSCPSCTWPGQAIRPHLLHLDTSPHQRTSSFLAIQRWSSSRASLFSGLLWDWPHSLCCSPAEPARIRAFLHLLRTYGCSVQRCWSLDHFYLRVQQWIVIYRLQTGCLVAEMWLSALPSGKALLQRGSSSTSG